MLLNLATYYSFRKFFLIPPIIPEIILREIALFTIVQQIITLSKLSATKDFLRRKLTHHMMNELSWNIVIYCLKFSHFYFYYTQVTLVNTY